MSSFRDQSFQRRYSAMGDQAEAVFEAVYPRGWARFGLNRPPVSLAAVPPFIRFMPDYMTSHGLVEVQGFGRDQRSKFKLPKLDALVEWDEHFPVTLFLYDSKNNECGFVGLHELLAVIAAETEGVTYDLFPEGTPYWAVPKAAVPTTWERGPS